VTPGRKQVLEVWVWTREPSGSRASAHGDDPSTRSPNGPTMRSIRWRTGRGGWRCCPSETRTLPRSGPYGGGSGRALPGRLSGGPGAVAAGWDGPLRSQRVARPAFVPKPGHFAGQSTHRLIPRRALGGWILAPGISVGLHGGGKVGLGWQGGHSLAGRSGAQLGQGGDLLSGSPATDALSSPSARSP